MIDNEPVKEPMSHAQIISLAVFAVVLIPLLLAFMVISSDRKAMIERLRAKNACLYADYVRMQGYYIQQINELTSPPPPRQDNSFTLPPRSNRAPPGPTPTEQFFLDQSSPRRFLRLH